MSDAMMPFAYRRLRQFMRMSSVDKCAVVALLVLCLSSVYIPVGMYTGANLAAAPYVSPPGLALVVKFQLALLAVWLGVLFAAIWLRRRSPENRLFVHAVIQLYSVGWAFFGYLFGTFTNPFYTIIALVGTVVGSLFFERRAVLLGLLSVFFVGAGTTIAEQTGMIPYAPLLANSPFLGGHLATSWLWGFGGSSFVLLLGTIVVAFLAVGRLRDSEDELLQTTQELKEAQTRLVQSEKMASLGQLVAGVAHELNNPASFVHGSLANLEDFFGGFVDAIQSYEQALSGHEELQLVMDDVRSRVRLDYLIDETPALLRICCEGSGRVKTIVDDLRVFARSDGGERKATDVRQGIESTLRLLGERFSSEGGSVRRAYAEIPTIEADEGQLNQVWMNILTNALDAIEGRHGGEVVISLHADGPAPGRSECWVEVEITDNGSGIEPSVVDRIFDPFYTSKPVGKGTGLGLSIAYGAVQSHGGEIAVASQLGCGTTVTVRLPCR